MKGDIRTEQFTVLSSELGREKEKAQERLTYFLQRTEEAKLRSVKHRDRKKMVQEYVNVAKLNRAMVEQLINHIDVSKRDPETKILHVEIHWNF